MRADHDALQVNDLHRHACSQGIAVRHDATAARGRRAVGMMAAS